MDNVGTCVLFLLFFKFAFKKQLLNKSHFPLYTAVHILLKLMFFFFKFSSIVLTEMLVL